MLRAFTQHITNSADFPLSDDHKNSLEQFFTLKEVAFTVTNLNQILTAILSRADYKDFKFLRELFLKIAVYMRLKESNHFRIFQLLLQAQHKMSKSVEKFHEFVIAIMTAHSVDE